MTATLEAPISRSTGYRLAAGKEEAGLEMAEAFFREVGGVALSRITDREENYRLGDFRAPTGHTIECKRQPIDPLRYPRNFVEVFEVTSNPLHANGFRRLAKLLSTHPEALKRLHVQDRTQDQPFSTKLGDPGCVSVSITSIATAVYTVYANPDNGYLYLYRQSELVRLISCAIQESGLVRGAGRSNSDTYAVFVPLPRWIWRRYGEGIWQWLGE